MKNPFKSILVLLILSLFSCDNDEPDEPINTPPSISVQTFDVSEAILDTENIGTVLATDADGDDLIFSIESNSGNLFEISTSGIIGLAQGQSLDYETTATHTLTVNVTDGKDSANATITINVIDVVENTAPVIDAQALSVDENSAIGTIVGSLLATDAENDALTFSTTTTTPVFSISNEGEIMVADAINFEATSSYQLDITVNDGVLTSTAVLTITVNDINDAPKFDSDKSSVTINEDVVDIAILGSYTATDEDGDAISYSITDDEDDLFTIDDSGSLRLQSGKLLDFETKPIHIFTIQAQDPDGAVGQIEITLNVGDVDEPQTVTVTSPAGSGVSGYNDGSGFDVLFDRPSGMAIAANGDLYIADENNSAIRKLDANGGVSTFAISNGLIKPVDLVFDSQGNLFVSDQEAFKIFIIDPSGSITTFAGSNRGFADGTGTNAQFGRITGIAIDDQDNLYVADNTVNRIRKITPAGVVTTIIGDNIRGFVDGALADARFNGPQDVTVDADGNIYLVDTDNFSIRKVTPTGTVSTLAGSTQGFADGTGSAAQFNQIVYLTIDAQGNLYTADGVGSYRIRKITPSGEVTTLAGDGRANQIDGEGLATSFHYPRGIVVSADGRTIYVSEYLRPRIRKLAITN